MVSWTCSLRRRRSNHSKICGSRLKNPSATAASRGAWPIRRSRLRLPAMTMRLRRRASSAAVDELKTELHALILTRIDFFTAGRADTDAKKRAELRDQIDKIATEFLASRADVKTAEDAARIRREVIEEALGLGPLESLLHEPDITEIMVNGHENVFVERAAASSARPNGSPTTGSCGSSSNASSRRSAGASTNPARWSMPACPTARASTRSSSRSRSTGRRLRSAVSARNACTSTISSKLGAMTPPVVDFLRAAVEARLNILVSGGTGSGKTTLLNVLSSFIPRAERIVTIEDAAELTLNQPHVVRLEARPPNFEGTGGVTIRDLVRNALRMRPDRIIVGECRGGEALDMLQAMNTGHDGSLTTIHANSARDALSRIETMVMMAGFELPLRAIREQTASAIDLVVQVARLRDGSRASPASAKSSAWRAT